MLLNKVYKSILTSQSMTTALMAAFLRDPEFVVRDQDGEIPFHILANKLRSYKNFEGVRFLPGRADMIRLVEIESLGITRDNNGSCVLTGAKLKDYDVWIGSQLRTNGRSTTK
jgi:hypothetical protein